MTKKIKLEITEAQLTALVEVVSECSAMIGASGEDADKNRTHWVELLDRLLKNNGYKREFL